MSQKVDCPGTGRYVGAVAISSKCPECGEWVTVTWTGKLAWHQR